MNGLDWATVAPGLLGLPVLGGLLYWGLPRLLRCWRMRHVWTEPGVPSVGAAMGGFRPHVPVRFHSPNGSEPTSPQELLPHTTAVGSFLAPPTPYVSRRSSSVPDAQHRDHGPHHRNHDAHDPP